MSDEQKKNDTGTKLGRGTANAKAISEEPKPEKEMTLPKKDESPPKTNEP